MFNSWRSKVMFGGMIDLVANGQNIITVHIWNEWLFWLMLMLDQTAQSSWLNINHDCLSTRQLSEDHLLKYQDFSVENPTN